jgi:predicted O-methyltransferase YrrM
MENFDELFRALNHDQRVEFAKSVFAPIGRYCHENRQYYIDIWEAAEASGFNLVISDYYSPIPSKKAIDRIAERGYVVDPSLLGFDCEDQKELQSRLAVYQEELAGTPFKPGKADEFFWTNGMFPIADAYLFYALIRQEKPRRIIEIGSGQSTLMALKALAKNGDGRISCIEPFPKQRFNEHLAGIAGDNYNLIVDELQNIPVSLFQELRSGDILFLDSSHVVKAQSDLVYFFFSILPLLVDGVWVHLHDIFLPYDYPLDFFTVHKRFHTEAYLLAAFLMHNRKFKTMFCNYYFLWQEHAFYLKRMETLLSDIEIEAARAGEAFDCRELFVVSEMPLRPHLMGGSYWMRS